jgi:ADP-ribosylglycohydrolase
MAALTAGSYTEGVRMNMLAGGDNCSRGIYVGALLGAAHGEGSVPAEWRAKLTEGAAMQAAAAGLFSS